MLTRSIRNWWLSLAGHSQPAVESPLAVQRTVYKPSAWFCAGWKFVCADDRAALARTLETSIASLQDPVEHTCLQAGLSLVHGEVQAAAATASIAIVARADFPFAYVLRARALRAQGMHSAALAEFKRAGELIPDDAQTLVEQAQEHLALGETADARDCYYLALAHAPDHPAALLGFARMLGESGDSRAALEQIRHAAHVAPLDAEIQFESALLHRRCDNLAGAVAAYERGLNLAPNDFAACTNLGLLYLSRLGDPRSAQR